MTALAHVIGGIGLVILGSIQAFYAVRASLISRDSPERPWVAPARQALLRMVYPFMAKNPRWFATEAGFGTAMALYGVALAIGGTDPRSWILRSFVILWLTWISLASALASGYWFWRLLRRHKARSERTAGVG
jgi:hypothetical protein